MCILVYYTYVKGKPYTKNYICEKVSKSKCVYYKTTLRTTWIERSGCEEYNAPIL